MLCIDLHVIQCLPLIRRTNMSVSTMHCLNLSVLLFLISLQRCFSKEQFFKDIAKELRCSGCDLTVKVLDRMLVNLEKTDIEDQVDRVLDHVCDIDRFSISEYNAKKMVRVCHFMKEYHGGELRKELIYHYSQPKKPTYLEFAQHICLDVMKMCAGVSHKWQDKEDTMLHIDSDHGFTVVPGRNIKMPNPVHEQHQEL